MTYKQWLELGLYPSDYTPRRLEHVAHPYELWCDNNHKFSYTHVDQYAVKRETGKTIYVWVSDIKLPAFDFIGFPVGEFTEKQRPQAKFAAKQLRIATLMKSRDLITKELEKLKAE